MIRTNKKIGRSAGIAIAFLCAIIANAGTAGYAQASDYAKTYGGFSIQAVIPDNQIDTRQTYFDLRMRPGDEQTVEIVITNSRDEELTAEVRLNAASTGRNGLIVYTEPDVRDKLMSVSIADIAALQAESVTIPARGSETVAINIKMPDTPIDGVILGGIAVTGGEAETDPHTTQGITLKNKITYVIALKLTESDNEAAADFDLTDITPELVNFRTAVVATLQNKAARIVKDMEISAQIFRKGSDTVLNELTSVNAEMAPLSSGAFVIDWKNRPLDRGTYRLKMTAKYDGRTWEWDEEFTIGTEAGDLNDGAVGLVKNYTWLYVILGLIVLVLVWFVAYRMGKRRKPDEDPRT